MKKRLVILAFISLCTISTYAQLRLGVRGGVSASVGETAKDVKDSKINSGYYVGPSLEFMVKNIGLETAILYARRELKSTSTTPEQKVDFLEIPLNLRGTIPTSEKVKIYIAAGPYIGFRVSGNDSFNEVKDNIDNVWTAKSFSAGLNFGTGVEIIEHFRIGINYNLGLTDNYKESDGSYAVKSRMFSLAAGIYF